MACSWEWEGATGWSRGRWCRRCPARRTRGPRQRRPSPSREALCMHEVTVHSSVSVRAGRHRLREAEIELEAEGRAAPREVAGVEPHHQRDHVRAAGDDGTQGRSRVPPCRRDAADSCRPTAWRTGGWRRRRNAPICAKRSPTATGGTLGRAHPTSLRAARCGARFALGAARRAHWTFPSRCALRGSTSPLGRPGGLTDFPFALRAAGLDFALGAARRAHTASARPITSRWMSLVPS